MNSDQESGDIMSGTDKEVLFLMLQFLREKNLKSTRHMLECESGLFFDIKYFEELVLNGNWDEAEGYLSYFINWDHDSIGIYFQIRKQKYLEALDRHDFLKATDILWNELVVFSVSYRESIKELTGLLRLNNFREHRHFTEHANAKIQRKILMETDLKQLLLQHPTISPKLQFSGKLNYSYAGLASPSAHLFPMGQIEPCQTIARSVPGLLSPQLQNLPTMYQQGGAPLASISNFRDISNTCLSGIPNTMMLPAPGEAGSSRPFFDANDPPSLSRIAPETVTKNQDVRNSELDKAQPNKGMKFSVLSRPNQIRSLTVSEPREKQIVRLIYPNSGTGLLALVSNGINLVWTPIDDTNPESKATMCPSQLWVPRPGTKMKNDLPGTEPKYPIHCFALSHNGGSLISASGGSISLFDSKALKSKVYMCPPPAATYLLFHPQDNKDIIVGMDDSTIQIFNLPLAEVKFKLAGHSRRITGLTFSTELNVLVSSAADAEIIVWEYNDGKFKEKTKALFVQFQGGRIPTSLLLDTQVHSHQDQKQFLAVNKWKLAIYETTELECKKQWCPKDLAEGIAHATFSCDSQLVYATFKDGIVSMFSASKLEVLCQIHRDAYLPSNVSSQAYPLVITAHPQKRDQFALGFSDGRVMIIELLESIAQDRVVLPPVESEPTRSKTPTAEQMVGSSSDNPHRFIEALFGHSS